MYTWCFIGLGMGCGVYFAVTVAHSSNGVDTSPLVDPDVSESVFFIKIQRNSLREGHIWQYKERFKGESLPTRVVSR